MGGSGSDLEGGDQLLALISSHQDEILKAWVKSMWHWDDKPY